MATLTKAAQRKVTKPKFKGKYPGPDKYKGKPPPKKKVVAKKPAPKPVVKPVVKPKTPAPTTPNLGSNVGANGEGVVGLQTNYDIESDVLEADQEQADATEQAEQLKSQALLNYTQNTNNAQQENIQNRTKAAGAMASRGMRGSAAANASANLARSFNENLVQAQAQKSSTEGEATNLINSAGSRRKTRQGQIELARKAYTDAQSAKNPTVGSTPANSGVTNIKPAAKKVVPKPVPKPAAKKVVAKPKFKGKYPGPDKYKGNAKLIAAAKRKAAKK